METLTHTHLQIYLPPPLFFSVPTCLQDCHKYLSEIDVWSFGCIFVECLTRKVLFPFRVTSTGQHNLAKVTAWLASPAPARKELTGRPPQAVEVVQHSLCLNPSERARFLLRAWGREP